MKRTLPHKIKNHLGQEVIFHRTEMDQGEEKLIVEAYIPANTPAIEHTFYMQDEYLVVLHGKMAYQIQNGPVKYAGIGETVFFRRAIPHKFWNAGTDELNCFGWIRPASDGIISYLESLYHSINESKSERPDQFDSAYLLYHYGKEFDMPEIPKFVKSLVLPATYGIGKLTGKYKKFKEAASVVEQ